jgi:hypothetical protein
MVLGVVMHRGERWMGGLDEVEDMLMKVYGVHVDEI